MTMIERIEITKGPSSTIFGSDAVAGAINVITKNPRKEPLVSLDIMGTSHLESFNNLSMAGTVGKFSGMVSYNDSNASADLAIILIPLMPTLRFVGKSFF